MRQSAVYIYMVYKLLPRQSTCCVALYRHCCLLALLRAHWEGGSSMRNEDFVRRGGKFQCTWKASLFCILMMQCVYTSSWLLLLLVCLCVYFTIALPPVSWITSLFLQFWHSSVYTTVARFELGLVVFTLVFRSVPCWTELCWHGCMCQRKRSINCLDSSASLIYIP